MDKLHAVAEALLEYETLTGSEVEDLLNGQDIVREAESENSDSSVGKTSSVPPTGTVGESDLSPNTNPGG